MTIGERIKEARLRKGLTLEQLGKAANIGKTTIMRYETGAIANIPSDKIEMIAKALSVTPAYIMGWDEESVVILDNYKIYAVPRYDSAAAGFGVIADSSPVGVDYLPFKNQWEADETMTVNVKGDSMYPKIEDGDIIAVRKQDSVDSGTVAVVLIDDTDAVVKKVTYGEDFIILHSFNPEYMDREFRGADVQRIRILGKVTKVIKEM